MTEEKNEKEDQPTERTKPSSTPKFNDRGPKLRLMLIWMATMAAMVVVVPRLAERYPEKFVWELPTFAGLLEGAGFTRDGETASIEDLIPDRPEDIVRRPKEEGDRGPIFRAPLVAWSAGQKLSMASISNDFVANNKNSFPSRIRNFNANTSCKFRRPNSGERVMSVNIEAGNTPAQIRNHMTSQIIALPAQMLDQAADPEASPETIFGGDMKVIDVIVTETAIPVYLVLQSMDDVVWNVIAHPDAMISHIAMIGGNAAGVALPDQDIPIEAVLLRDFAPGSQRDCAVRPWRRPDTDWPLDEKAQSGDPVHVSLLNAYKDGHKTYEAWYNRTFGVDTRSYAVNAMSAAQVMVGPKPLSPISYRPYDQARLSVTSSDHMILGSKSERNQQSASLLSAHLGQDIDVDQLVQSVQAAMN